MISILLGIGLVADTVVESFGVRVWLRDSFDSTGRRIGVIDCCTEANPCPWHEALGRARCHLAQLRREPRAPV
jgi:hypothetical protein